MALKELKNTSEILPGEIQEAVDSQLSYWKLYSFKLIAKSSVGLVNLIIFSLFGLAIIFFLTVFLALALGVILNNNLLGFLIVGAGLVFICLLVFLLRKIIITKPILKYLSSIYFNKND